MININAAVVEGINEGGLKVVLEGGEIKAKIARIAIGGLNSTEIEKQLARVEAVIAEKIKQITEDAEKKFGESLNNYSVQAVEKKELVPVKEENKIIKNIKNMFAKMRMMFNKKEQPIEVATVDKESQKDSMKKIFREGFKLSLKLVLDKLLSIGAIIDVFEFAGVVKDEILKTYTNERPNKTHDRELVMEH